MHISQNSLRMEIKEQTNSSVWDTLSDAQKSDVLLSYEESENDENLLDHNEVMSKYRD